MCYPQKWRIVYIAKISTNTVFFSLLMLHMLFAKTAYILHRENIYKYSTFLFVGVTYTYNPFDFMVTDIFNGFIDIDRGCSLIIAR